MSDALLLALLVLAAFRCWRFFALDDLPPLERLRERVVEWVADRHGTEWASGFECPWCSGWWVSCAVVGATWNIRPLPLPGLWFLAVAAGVALLAQLSEQ